MLGDPTGYDEALRTLGLSDLRRGARAMGHSGPDTDDWEEYAEVPVSDLIRIADELKKARVP